ncbi:MAG: hypothetical protein J5820_02365, partial [Rhodocyclaceae bacterium]|nr:hypothetical protein [Rhodocyclaceae bacterium]
MKRRNNALCAAVLLACAGSARAQEAAVVELAPVTSTASAPEEDTNIGQTRLDAGALSGARA